MIDSFPDVPSEHWAHDYIDAVAHFGVMTGYPDGTFRPDELLTRAEQATVAARLLEMTGHLVPNEPDPPEPVDGNIGRWLPEGFAPKVALPQGHIGALAGAEVIDPPGNLDGDTLENKHIVIPKGYDKQWVARNGDLIGCTVSNPHSLPVGNTLKNGYSLGCLFDGVNGDAWKAGEDESVSAVDCVVVMGATGGDKHYDGMQVFRNGAGHMERCLIDWNNAGTIGHTTGAVFTQDQARLYARDVTVVNPGGSNELLELHGSGGHDVDRVHVWGVRRENWQGFGLWPARLLSGLYDVAVFHNDVPGASIR